MAIRIPPEVWWFLQIIASLAIGSLFSKKVGRFLTTTWKWVANDPTTIDLISVRTYKPTEKIKLDNEVFQAIKARVPNIKYDSVTDNSLQMGLSPFGTLIVLISSKYNFDDKEKLEEIKISLVIKNPLRVGYRHIDLVHEYIDVINQIFPVIENLFSETPQMNYNYILVEMPRIRGWLEKEIIDIDDKELATHVRATIDNITLAAKPPLHITKAVKKYWSV